MKYIKQELKDIVKFIKDDKHSMDDQSKDYLSDGEVLDIVTNKLNELIQTSTMDLKEVSSEDLRQELELRGNYTENLWHVDDVMKKYDCTSEEALNVLDSVMQSEWMVETIFDMIDEQAEAKGIKEKTYPFNEGDDYWTIEGGVVVHSYWDEESEEMYDENPNTKYFNSREEAHEFLTKNK